MDPFAGTILASPASSAPKAPASSPSAPVIPPIVPSSPAAPKAPVSSTPAPNPTPAAPSPAIVNSDPFAGTLLAAPKGSTTTTFGERTGFAVVKSSKNITAPVSPYWATTTPSGASFGPSQTLDESGVPLLDYRKPGDTATTTDPNRVDTTFDPTVAQPVTSKQVITPRMPESESSTIKKQMGGTPTDQLDHTNSLELAGSNEKSNLRIEPDVPGTQNTATDPLENTLGQAVQSGNMSLFDAQVAEAKAKGVPVPYTGGSTDPSLWDKFTGAIKSGVEDVKGFMQKLVANSNSNPALAGTPLANTQPVKSTPAQQPLSDVLNIIKQGQGLKLSENDGTGQPSVGLKNTQANVAASSFMNAGNDALQKGSDALASVEPGSTDSTSEKIGKVGQAVISMINFGFSLTGVPEALAALSTIKPASFSSGKSTAITLTGAPAFGTVARGITWAFEKLGQLGNWEGTQVINSLPISQEAKTNLTPFVNNLFGLLDQVAGGEVVHETVAGANEEVNETSEARAQAVTQDPRATGPASKLTDITEKVSQATSALTQAISSILFDRSNQVKGPTPPAPTDETTQPNENEPATAKAATQYQPLFRGPKIDTGAVAGLLKDYVPEDKVSLVFDPDLLKEEGNLGQFKDKSALRVLSPKIKDVIELYDNNGKTYVRTAFHEAYHYLESLMTPEMLKDLNDKTLAKMTDGDHTQYDNAEKYPTAESRAAEYRADEFAKEQTSKAGYKSPLGTVIDTIKAFIQKLIDIGNNIVESIKNTPNKEGGFAKNPFADEQNRASEEYNKEQAKIEKFDEEQAFKASLTSPELENLRAQRDIAEEALQQNPARHLIPFTNKITGELPEVLGDDKGGKFRQSGDDIASQHGFEYSEDARKAVADYKMRQSELRDLNQQIKEKTEETNARALRLKDERALAKLSDKTDKHISKLIGDRDAQEERVARTKKAAEEGDARVKQNLKEVAERESNLTRSIKENSKGEGILSGIKRSLEPVKSMPDSTRDIVRTWLTRRNMADILAKEEHDSYPGHEKEGMNTIIAQQDGAKIPYLTNAFDDMRAEGNARGLDIAYQENYMPQVWKESAMDISKIIAKRMEAQGVSQVDIQAYLDGVEKLDEETATRLKLNPFFTKEKVIPDYRTGIEIGLHPEYDNPVDLIANYRRDMETAIANRNLSVELQKNGDLLPVDLNSQAPKGWKVTSIFGRSYWAPPHLADFLDDYLRGNEDLSWQQKIAEKASHAAIVVQNVGLMSGIPGTTVQAFPLSVLYAETFGYGNFSAIKPWIIANSDAMTASWLEKNWTYVKMMGEDGINVQSLARDSWDKSTISEVIKSSNLLNLKDLGTVGREIWNRGWMSKTFDRMIPMLSTELYKRIYEDAVAKGMPEDDARELASQNVQNKYVLPEPQGKTTQQVIRSVAYGPVWRQQIMRTLWNSAKGWTTEFSNPEFTQARKLAIGMALTFAAYQVINKRTSGQFTWQNASGHEMDIAFPNSDGSVTYATFFPSWMTVPKLIAGVGTGLAKGDIAAATQSAVGLFNPNIQTIGQVLTNKDYFGRPIYKTTDSATTKIAKIAAYAGSETVVPQILKDAIAYLDGTNTGLQSFIALTGGMVKYQSSASINSSGFYEGTQAQIQAKADEEAAVLPLFNKAQAFIAAGNQAAADLITGQMSAADYAIYKTLKATATRTATLKGEAAMYGIVEKAHDYILQGNQAAADALTSALTPTQYKDYLLAKKKLGY